MAPGNEVGFTKHKFNNSTLFEQSGVLYFVPTLYTVWYQGAKFVIYARIDNPRRRAPKDPIA